MKVCITAGGTGGHIVPALSFAEKLKEKIPEAQILFITGKSRESERKFIENIQKKFYVEIDEIRFLEVKGVVGKGFTKSAKGLVSILTSIPEAKKILKDFSPDITIGFGGYLTAPVIISSKILGIKTAIHEQNSVMGTTNKIASLFIDKIFTSFEDTEKIPYFARKKVINVGMPIRKKFLEDLERGRREKEKEGGDNNNEKITIFVTGGSQGAASLNIMFLEAIESIIHKIKRRKKIIIYHQTGNISFDDVRRRYEKLESEIGADKSKIKPFVFPFTDEMGYYLGLCDFVVSRGGAGSVFEIAEAKKPAIFVPLPHSAGGHQEKNPIKIFGDACIVIPQNRKDRFEINLYELIEGDILYILKRRTEEKVKTQDGSEKMINEILKLVSQR